MQDPDLITSGLSRQVDVEGHTLKIEIYRIVTEPGWTLEVVDEAGTSTVWDDPFDSDEVALKEAMTAIKDEGVSAFVIPDNVILFPRS